MTTRSEFLDILAIRGWQRDWVIFKPGPDADRNPDGAVVVEAPTATSGQWRAYLMDVGRGPQFARAFDSESDAYDYALREIASPILDTQAPPMDRAGFLAEIDRRGLPRAAVHLPEDSSPAGVGALVLESGEPWRIFQNVPEARIETSFLERAAYRIALTMLTEMAYRGTAPGSAGDRR